jgi:hypothetical protein
VPNVKVAVKVPVSDEKLAGASPNAQAVGQKSNRTASQRP